MPTADLFIRAGDTSPALTDTILDASGNTLTTLSSVTLRMRSLQTGTDVALTGIASIVSGANVRYVWSSTDTGAAGPGLYMAEWACTLTGGGTYTYPNDGYRTISIEPALSSIGQTLVSIPDAKDVLNISADDRSHDLKLLRFIQGVQVIVESQCGPVVPQIIEEWHNGGSIRIALRRRPSTALGTSPLLVLMACSEYLGPIEWPLSIVQSPDLAQIYSCMLDARRGVVIRTTAGGGVQPFADQGPMAVHVVYQAGQSKVPANIYEGTLEIVRDFYQKTQQAGPAAWGNSTDHDEYAPSGPPMGFLIAGRVREWLGPMRRRPSIA